MVFYSPPCSSPVMTWCGNHVNVEVMAVCAGLFVDAMWSFCGEL